MSFLTVKSGRGNEKFFAKVGNVDKSTKKAVRQAWFGLGRDLKTEVNREILRKPKGGRTYIIKSRNGRRRRHVASAPGETHANLQGRLRKSVSWKVHGIHSMDFGYGVSVTGDVPKHGPFVEFGTRKMAARPSLDNAIKKTRRVAGQHFTRVMNGEFN